MPHELAPFPRATRIEGLRFTAEVALPNLIQGLFQRRRRLVWLVAKTGVENRGRSLLSRLRDTYGDGPTWVGGAKLVVFGPDQIRFALASSPEPFAADPDPKRSGMRKFQPSALTISRDPVWSDRRRFTESVLDRAVDTLGGRVDAVVGDEAARLHGDLDFETFHATLRRMARRIVLGDAAMSDYVVTDQLSQLMRKANPPGRGDPGTLETFTTTLNRYVEQADPTGLVSLFADAPTTPDTDPAGQLPHWLFGLADTVAINVWRCLALLASHPGALGRVRDELSAGADRPYLQACLREAIRLWPTTAIISRVTTRTADWDGRDVPADTQVYVVNSFNHRDATRFDFADQFRPEAWLDGTLADGGTLNYFGNGPQRCPGAKLATQMGTAVLADILHRSEPAVTGVTLDPAGPLPYVMDHFAVRIRLSRRSVRRRSE